MSFDLHQARQNPYPMYEQARRENPRSWHESFGAWIFTDFASVKFLLEDPRFSATRAGTLFLRFSPEEAAKLKFLATEFSNWIMLRDEPSHSALRAPLAKSLSSIRAIQTNDLIARVAGELLEVSLAKPEGEAISEFAYPFPMLVLCDLLGIPRDRYPWLRQHSRHIATSFGIGRAVQPSFEVAWAGQESAKAVVGFLNELLHQKRQAPGADLLSQLVDHHSDTLLSNLVFFILAGHETSTHLIGNGVHLLGHDPDLFAFLTRNSNRVPDFVEEVLRYESPVQLTSRLVKEDFVYRGAKLRAGDKVYGIIGSANRDEAVFSHAHRFDIHRENNAKNLAFGAGIHFCLGASLARTEARIFFETLLKRREGRPFQIDQAERAANVSFRGFETLSVRWAP